MLTVTSGSRNNGEISLAKQAASVLSTTVRPRGVIAPVVGKIEFEAGSGEAATAHRGTANG